MRKLLIIPLIIAIGGCSNSILPHNTEAVGEKPKLEVGYGVFSGLHAKWSCDGYGKIGEISWKSGKGQEFVLKDVEVNQTPSVTDAAEVAKIKEISELAKQEIQMLAEMRKMLVGISDAISAGWGNPIGTAFKYIGQAAVAKYATVQTTQPTTQPAM